MEKLRRHHDDQYIDQVRISLVPRFKSSGLSGDEWRVSALLELLRKGIVVWSRSFRNIETAVNALPWFLMTWAECDDARLLTQDEEGLRCQQPGCASQSSRVYRLRGRAAGVEGDMADFRKYQARHRWFCERHAHRGDCHPEDCDDNYEVVGGGNSQASPIRAGDVSPSVFGGVIVVGDDSDAK